jgi:hypothetical protein
VDAVSKLAVGVCAIVVFLCAPAAAFGVWLFATRAVDEEDGARGMVGLFVVVASVAVAVCALIAARAVFRRTPAR